MALTISQLIGWRDLAADWEAYTKAYMDEDRREPLPDPLPVPEGMA